MKNHNAVFLVGGPGSGKDFVLRTALKESGAIEIPLTKLQTAIQSNQDLAEVNGGPLIVNGNADDGNAICLAKAVLEAMGYTTALIHVYTSDEVSMSRSKINEDKRSPRYLQSVANMLRWKEVFGEGFFLFDNTSNFVAVNEEMQGQIIIWLLELNEGIEKYYTKKIATTHAVAPSKEPHHVPAGYERVKDGAFNKLRKKPTPIENQADTVREDIDTLFEKSYPTIVDMIAQKTGKREGDKYKGGIAVAGDKATSREVVESNQEVVVPQTQAKGVKYSKNRPAKGAKPPGDTFDARMGAVPSGGIGLTAYKEETEPKTLKQLRNKD